MKTTKYKLMALDVDGTLVNSERVLTAPVRDALIKAQEEYGIRLIIASGRPTAGLREIARELQLDRYSGYLMPFNGGEVYNCRAKNPIASYLLPEGIATELYGLSKEYGLTILTYDAEHILSENIGDPYLLKEVEITGMSPKQVANFSTDVPQALPKCLIVGPPDRIEALEPIVKERFAGRVNAFRSHPSFLEVVPEGVHKAASLSRLLERLDYDRSELIAVGDSFNDLEMIQYAGLGVAMANAREAIKACADYVTKSNDEDGVAHLLAKYLFNHHDESPYTVEEFNSLIPGTLMEALGIRCVEVAKGYIVGTMPVDNRTAQPMGIIHGGANLAFAETMAGYGSLALLEEGEMQVGAQVSGNHVASAMTGDTMRAEARIMHRGRSTHVWSVEIYSQKSGKLVHTARVLNSILKRR
ncbi:Cof-type HAD-IIB family hydrolase [Porphyromonas sp. COT-290 OH860]|uniref:Cof-type HAD-IIB family hydrolase n=1 Tax=Porphyromonas sp. COT-290 OH860 TaxID=1515615 RepID=UPI00052C0582|nr:Cof-type HAD-IIB family hydrolase [Porphyromonas sp. COT-290 OH860]KGN83988.1 haloacid dehalogenase [Porphyromonas sp. COT-290 OH860]